MSFEFRLFGKDIIGPSKPTVNYPPQAAQPQGKTLDDAVKESFNSDYGDLKKSFGSLGDMIGGWIDAIKEFVSNMYKRASNGVAAMRADPSATPETAAAAPVPAPALAPVEDKSIYSKAALAERSKAMVVESGAADAAIVKPLPTPASAVELPFDKPPVRA